METGLVIENALARRDNGENHPITKAKGLRRGRRKLEAVLSRDAHAVLSTFHPNQRIVGTLLSRADGGSSFMCNAAQAVCVAVGIYKGLTSASGNAAQASMEPNALLRVAAALWGLGLASLGLVVSSTRDALRPDGALDQLGAGKAKISAHDDKTLSRWRVGLAILAVVYVLIGLVMIASGLTGGIALTHPSERHPKCDSLAPFSALCCARLSLRQYAYSASTLTCTDAEACMLAAAPSPPRRCASAYSSRA